MPGNLITPEDFATLAPPERIMGIETEYDARRPNGSNDTDWIRILLADNALAMQGLRQACDGEYYHWLSNGAMIYPDVGHLEYCTPESLGPTELTAATHAGSILLDRLVQVTDAPYHIYRRSATVDANTGKVVTKGFHVNFCIPDSIANTEALEPLEAHLATQLYAWGGLVTKRGFSISPKSFDIGGHITTSLGSRTLPGGKPMGIVRNATQGGDSDTNLAAHGLGRFEDRTKTPSSMWSDFMGAATTSALLRVIEHPHMVDEQRRLASLRLRDSTDALKAVASDMSLQKVLRLADGRQMTALDIQENLASIAEVATKQLLLPVDEVIAVGLWKQIIADLRQVQRGEASLKLVADRIGWASKFVYLSRKLGEDALMTGSIDALRYCLSWDMVSPRGAGQIFEEKRGREIVSPQAVENLTNNPPQGTRAKPRSEYIVDGGTEHSGLGYTRWPFVTLIREGVGRNVTLHPYDTERPQLGRRSRSGRW